MKIRMTFAVDNKSTPLPIEGFNQGLFARDYNVTPEGKQFIVLFPLERIQPGDRAVRQIKVVLNWLEELQRRMPVK